MNATNNTYHFDFIKAYGENIENVDVVFPDDDIDSIIINGKRQRGYCGHVGESGMSKDGLYHRVHLADYTFWVDPSDYQSLINLLDKRQEKARANTADKRAAREIYYTKQQEELERGTLSDSINDDIYYCFLAGTPDGCLIDQFEKLKPAIEQACAQHGGRLYKTMAKSAKFAIVSSYRYYTDTQFDYLRSLGYKVVKLEDAVEYMGLTDLWAKDEVQQAQKILNEQLEPHMAETVDLLLGAESSLHTSTIMPISKQKKWLFPLGVVLIVLSCLLLLAVPVAGIIGIILGILEIIKSKQK